MKSRTRAWLKRSSLVVALASLAVSQLPACGNGQTPVNGSGTGGQVSPSTGGQTASGGQAGSDASPALDVSIDGGGIAVSDSSPGRDVAIGTDGATGAADLSISDNHVVAMVQSTKAEATDLTIADVAELVASAVAQAGGLDFIGSGQTVVLKPNLLTAYKDGWRKAADQTVNGISTDWRVVKAVADLVRAQVGSNGKILVMEGSVMPTLTAYAMLGYTKENMEAVDEFIAIEGSSCADRSTSALVQRPGRSGRLYWVNQRYVEADVVISLPVMKTHLMAGITGAVKNLGIGTTPVGQYRDGEAGAPVNDCTRGQTASTIDHSTPEALGAFIRDYYSVRPADFVVMDALQGLEHGPLPVWDPPSGDGGGSYSYDDSRKNMRLILAGRNAVAVDTVQALVMKCDPRKVPYLTLLEADGLGTTDIAKITVVGKQPGEVATPFACKLTDICPGI
jgi:uncharacterized protein (DUF362 family)